MKNRYFLIPLVLFVAMIFFAVSVLAARSGTFSNADFFAPDYNNGATETLGVGESRVFNYGCLCGEQPGNSVCDGYIKLQMDSGNGFYDVSSALCSVGEREFCSATYSKTFSSTGTYKFRVFCDEVAGTDFVQPSNEYVVLNVEDAGCSDGDTRLCPNQQGVCQGSYETCTNGEWPGCDYTSITSYENPEVTCDGLDNDCNGFVDDVDVDGDGSSACGGMGFVNELLINGLNNDYGNITVFVYNPSTSSYEPLWSTDTPDMTGATSGGEIGDLTHDGINDFVITRHNETSYWLELWTYDSVNEEWYLVWSKSSDSYIYIHDIGDFDNDGFDELFILDRGGAADTFEVWGNDTYNVNSLNLEAVIMNCTVATYHNGAGDLDNDGIPELFAECAGSETMQVFEYNPTYETYDWVADITLPNADGSSASMTVDDMECNGDVNHNGVVDCVFCGNSNAVHVLTYTRGAYTIEFNSTPGGRYSQSCSAADITNDGYADFFDVNTDGTRVWSYQNGSYVNIWTSPSLRGFCEIAASFAGDSDNDGKGECLYGTASGTDDILLWESDDVEATSFANTFTWSPSVYSVNIMIGNLNPFNDNGTADCNDNDDSVYPGALEICGDGIDQDCDGSDLACNCVDVDEDGYDAYDPASCPSGNDCNDNDASINPGASEVCGDSVDNDCDDEVDEGCGPVCGDGICDGIAYGEDCRSCPADCPSARKGVCCGDGKCDSRKGETAGFCAVDCT